MQVTTKKPSYLITYITAIVVFLLFIAFIATRSQQNHKLVSPIPTDMMVASPSATVTPTASTSASLINACQTIINYAKTLHSITPTPTPFVRSFRAYKTPTPLPRTD